MVTKQSFYDHSWNDPPGAFRVHDGIILSSQTQPACQTCALEISAVPSSPRQASGGVGRMDHQRRGGRINTQPHADPLRLLRGGFTTSPGLVPCGRSAYRGTPYGPIRKTKSKWTRVYSNAPGNSQTSVGRIKQKGSSFVHSFARSLATVVCK